MSKMGGVAAASETAKRLRSKSKPIALLLLAFEFVEQRQVTFDSLLYRLFEVFVESDILENCDYLGLGVCLILELYVNPFWHSCGLGMSDFAHQYTKV